ncbi:MAG: hypothetical protein RLZZ258_1426 [Actinomycetota bacterium]|jgi:teichoic acid transport system permease protein
MDYSAYAEAHGLKRMGARPPFSEYLRDAWVRRDFAVTLSAYSNEAANSHNRLGRWWTVLLPTIQAGTYGLIFGLILQGNRPDNFLPFLFTGVFLFAFFSASFSSGASALTGNVGLVKSLSFPRILLPISSVLSQFFNFLPQLGVLALLLIGIQQTISWSWLALIPIMILMVIFASGLAMIAARLTVQVRDLSQLIPFVTRIAFYISGIFFSIDTVLSGIPVLHAIMQWNPIYDFVELARGAVVVGHEMTPHLWIATSVWAFGLFIFGTIFFWRAEERYGRD